MEVEAKAWMVVDYPLLGRSFAMLAVTEVAFRPGFVGLSLAWVVLQILILSMALQTQPE